MNGTHEGREELSVDPADITTAANRIDALAERLRTAMTAVERAGNPVPAGSDEVSERAAGTLSRESDDLLAVVSETADRMRVDATGLRGHAASYERADEEISDLFAEVRR